MRQDGVQRMSWIILSEIAVIFCFCILVFAYFYLAYFRKIRTDLSASEGRYRCLVDLSPDGIAVFCEDVAAYVNASALRILGASTQGELLGKPILDFVHPDGRQIALQRMQDMQRGKTVGLIEQKFIGIDGRVVDVEAAAAPILFEGKQGMQVVFRDITERRRSQEALQDQKEFSESLIQNSTISTFVLDSEHKVILWNKACEELTGITAPEVIGTDNHWKAFYDHERPCLADTIIDGIHHDLAKLYDSFLNPNLISEGLRAEGWYSNLGGKRRYIVFEAAPIYNSKGKLVAVIEMHQDYTDRKTAEEALENERNFTSTILDTVGTLVVLLDREGRIALFNRACEKITGYEFEEVRGYYIWDKLIPPEDIESIKDVFEELTAGQFPNRHENCWLTKRGKRRLISWSNSVLLGDDGELQWTIATGIDITERRQAEEQIRKQSQAIEQSPTAVVITDTGGIIEYVNPKFTELTGYSAEEAIGKNPRILKSGETSSEEYKRLWATITSGGEWRGGFHNKKKNGELYWESTFISPIKSPDGTITHFLAVKEDITDRKQAEETITYMSHYDTLTGLPNRALFNDRLNLALAHAHRNGEIFAVMWLDLDSFKNINDTLGHVVGDQILQGISKRLESCLREGDTVARLGGDEFVLLLPQITNVEDVVKVVQKVFVAIQPPFNFDGRDFYTTTSIGISLYPYDGEDSETLIKNAEVALYRAKEQGRANYQLYAPDMNEKAFERLAMENSMRRALEREEFIVYYQPIVNIATGQIVSMEALIRWQHPTLGLVSPADFIPLAEETGLIVPIGEWALKTACAQNKAWQEAGLSNIRISVNLSARQFQQPNLVEMVNQTLWATGLVPEYLEFEITESVVMKDADAAIATLRTMKKRGIEIAIDDFGTGYSSLGYLKHFPIDRLKIDRLFIHTIIEDSSDSAITKAIISMAKGLNLRVVAEGVETIEQLEFLDALGCDEMQGYLYSRPVPAKEAAKLLKSSHAKSKNLWSNQDSCSA